MTTLTIKKPNQIVWIRIILAIALVAVATVLSWCWRQAAVRKEIATQLPMVPAITSLRSKTCTVLMYHHLVPAEDLGSAAENNAIITPESFEEQMKYLAENGYHTIFFSELLAYMNNGQGFPEKTVVITFDDGYESNYIYAYPILKKYGLTATINVVVKSSEIAKDRVAGESYNPSVQSHLTMNELREMEQSGVIEIQSHSYDGHGQIVIDANSKKGGFFVNHIYADGKSETDTEYVTRISADLKKSKEVLEKELGHQIVAFAYPYGLANEKVKSVLKANGFLGAVTTKNGQVEKGKTDRYAIPRVNISPKDTLETFAAKLSPVGK